MRYLSRTIDIYIYMHIVFDKFLVDTQQLTYEKSVVFLQKKHKFHSIFLSKKNTIVLAFNDIRKKMYKMFFCLFLGVRFVHDLKRNSFRNSVSSWRCRFHQNNISNCVERMVKCVYRNVCKLPSWVLFIAVVPQLFNYIQRAFCYV